MKKSRLFAKSVEQEIFLEALKEWDFTGKTEEFEEDRECEYCGQRDLRTEYTIENRYNEAEMVVGSACVLEFSNAEYPEDDGQGVDYETLDRDEAMLKFLVSFDKDQDPRLAPAYLKQGYFTREQAIQFGERLDLQNSRHRRKLKVKINDQIKLYSVQELKKLSQANHAQVPEVPAPIQISPVVAAIQEEFSKAAAPGDKRNVRIGNLFKKKLNQWKSQKSLSGSDELALVATLSAFESMFKICEMKSEDLDPIKYLLVTIDAFIQKMSGSLTPNLQSQLAHCSAYLQQCQERARTHMELKALF